MTDTGQPKEKKQSIAKDLVIVGGIVVLILGIIGGLLYMVVDYACSLKDDSNDVKEKIKQERAIAKANERKRSPLREEDAIPSPPEVAALTPKDSDSDDVKTLPKVEQKKQSHELAVVDLDADTNDVNKHIEYSLFGFDVRYVKLSVTNVKDNVVLNIPLGMRVSSSDESNKCSFVVYEPQKINLKADMSASDFYIKVVGLDSASFRVPVGSCPFKVSKAPTGDDKVGAFVEFAVARTSSWNVVQTGVWVVNNNISRQQIGGYRIAYSDPAVPGQSREVSVASYSDVKKVEGFISAMGWNPDEYRLFKEERDELSKLLRDVDFKDPSSDFENILRNKLLVRYKGSSAVEKVLLQYMRMHKSARVRKYAFENLMGIGLGESRKSLLNMALYPQNLESSFLAAYTLLQMKDQRSWPIIAVLGSDVFLAQYTSGILVPVIKGRTKIDKLETETLLDYWERAVGWSNSGFTDADTVKIKRSLSQLKQKIDPDITDDLLDIVSSDDAKVLAAARRLSRYSRSKKAFDAICRATLNARSSTVKRTLVYSLAGFRDFNPGDLCMRLVKSGDEVLMQAAVYLASSVRYDGFESVLVHATQSNAKYVRINAIQSIGNNKINELESCIIKIARYDSDPYVKDVAMRSLVTMKSPESLKMINTLLRTGNKNNKYKAMNLIRMWGNDPRSLAIAERYRRDPVIGTQVVSLLKRYGR